MSQTPDPLMGVTIGAREIYDIVVRLTGRVDVLIAQQEDSNKHVNDHELRIRALERNRWPVHLITMLIAAAALVVAILKNSN